MSEASANDPVYVTQAFLPPREEYLEWLDKVYASHQLTNCGPIHNQLEETLRQRFGVPHLRLMANGTLALQLALRALGVKGRVITTPFSYVATTSAILWEGCEPVFVDIDPATCNIDPHLIEAAITPGTTAILATHVYGTPCDVEAIDAIAKRHGLKVIYDGAHAFDVNYKGRSLAAYGDAFTCSFHATKLFHTVEGGAVVLHRPEEDRTLWLLRSFGHYYEDHHILGINAKMSELHAAMGMSVLPHVPHAVRERGRLVERYDAIFQGTAIVRPRIPEGTEPNHAYYPAIMPGHASRERFIALLEAEQVFPRRYFQPSLDALPYVHAQACPRSRSAASRVVCLPLYPGMPGRVFDVVARAVEALPLG